MNALVDALAVFHFVRPGWLALVPAALALWWSVRARSQVGTELLPGLAPHLAAALRIGGERGPRLLPIDAVAAVLALVALGAAGPTWSRVPSPFVAETAPLAIALSASESMATEDVAPSRMERAKQKILDLLDARGGARTALVAYAGTAHRVVPLSEDPAVLKPFIEGLSPDVMPEPGRNAAAALALASEALESESVPGAILFVLDALSGADVPAFAQHAAAGGVGVVFLAVGSAEADLDVLERVPGASVVSLTPDTSDVQTLERRVASAYRDALAQDDRQAWEERGWMLAWPAALLTLACFRRGFTLRLCLFVALGLVGLGSAPARAQTRDVRDTIERWLFTPDQRGRLAFAAERYDDAAASFEDPLWKGYVLSFLGRYDEAAATLQRSDSADAAFAQGVAFVKGREVRRGITAFETALARDPRHAAAAHNLEVARAILAYLERVREETDTGEGSEGADEIVFDAETEGGVEQTLREQDRAKLESAEQWMRTVETRTADFLRLRFALEAAHREAEP